MGCAAVNRLENDLSTELNDASRSRGLNLTEAWVVRIVSNRRSNPRAGKWVEPILRVIKDVEPLNSELERNSLSKFEILPYAQVPVVDSGPAQDIAPAVAELSRQRLAESNS